MPRRGIFEEDSDARKAEVGARLQGDVTSAGARAFERARTRFARLHLAVMGFSRTVSDADTIEFLARGEDASRAYLVRKRDAA